MKTKGNLVRLNEDQLNELSDYLLGSTHTLDEGLASIGLTFDQLDNSSFDNLYASVFKCDWCGYWCDESENCGEQCCYQCALEGKDGNGPEEALLDFGSEDLEDLDNY